MKFVHAGVKMFMKQDSQGQDICRWRIQTEGLPIVEGWVGEGRTIRLWKKSTLRKLLVEMFPRIGSRDNPEAGWTQLGEIGEQVLDISMGCCVLRVEASESEDGLKEALTLPLWRSLHSLNLMLPKEERRAMLLRIFNEDVELVNNAEIDKLRAKEREAAAKEEPVGSISGEADAQQLQEMIATAPNTDAADIKAAEAYVPNESQLTGDAMKIEEDAIAARDRMDADAIAAAEDENVKITNAMPERDGEGDEYNKTL